MVIGFKPLTVLLYVVKTLNHPFILGLDLMSAFNLEISPNLQIFQHININGIEHKEEILPIKTNNETPNYELQTLSVPIKSFHITKINQLIQQFPSVFAFDKYDIGLISSSICDIELFSHTPINLRPYRCNPKERKVLEEQIQNLINKNLIQKSTSQYALSLIHI